MHIEVELLAQQMIKDNAAAVARPKGSAHEYFPLRRHLMTDSEVEEAAWQGGVDHGAGGAVAATCLLSGSSFIRREPLCRRCVLVAPNGMRERPLSTRQSELMATSLPLSTLVAFKK